ncbi:Tether containing UBX domain for GLUT4 [Mortierella alpina]|uniref:Tether containing UBX domain for GLUT4 n=1 Tax=Mortierella alpina TaxID=64518 RepID=A0A9P6JAR1_MORAP|nr:Tether containing UBX domain for GLUT4 [Mortierella alpina]
MASQITICLLNTAKTQTINTTPTTILRQIVQAVCEKQSYGDPGAYGLRSGNITLDLSLSVQCANVAPGAKLELVKVPHTTTAPMLATVALQLEDGQRVVQTLATTATLWDVLLGAEQMSSGSLNLTRRTGTPPASIKNMFALQRRLSRTNKTASQVYMLPVVVAQEREYASFKSLKSTTLEQAGMVSENATMRVIMRHKSSGIEKYMEELEPGRSLPKGDVAPTSSMQTRPAFADRTNDVPVAPVRAPEIRGRIGSIFRRTRDGAPSAPPHNGGSPSNRSDGGSPSQTPTQDINSAMVEATQEIRQLREQQTQEALTDRVKRLSKSADGSSSDKDRFVRSMTLCDEPEEILMASPQHSTTHKTPPLPRTASPISTTVSTQTSMPQQQQPLPQDDLVRQIAQRVSQQLKLAQLRGDSGLNYHSLIAQEIVKEQRAGSLPISLPISPAESRKNSVDAPGSRTHGTFAR